jgi:tetratricopeptide (TPR) repeat protein
MLSKTFLVLVIVAITTSAPAQQPSLQNQVDRLNLIDSELAKLEPFIGGFPPNIKDEEQKTDVEEKYQKLVDQLNSALTVSPNDLELLYRRGKLFHMGHNFDAPGALENAEQDLTNVIKRAPDDKRAFLELGSLYVSTNPSLAPKAEALFLQAQKVHGREPLEEAHRGLIFAYYYQGKMQKALGAADLVLKLSLKDEALINMRDIIRTKVR